MVAKKRLIEIASPKSLPFLRQIKPAFDRAMESPMGPRLSDIVAKGSRVLILTVDLTRPSPKYLLRYMTKALSDLGAKPDIMVALGNHRPMTKEELIKHLGTADVMQSDPKGPIWELGMTSFGTPIQVDRRLKDYDLRIAVGFVEPSYLLGFTGGRKMLMPGVASANSIAHNHFMLLAPGRKLGVLKGNQLSDDALEFAKAVGLHWIVDVVLNPDDSYAAIYCGDMEKANETACALSARIYKHRFSRPADIVIVSCGGYPYDFDLVQTKKGVVPALECVRKGGTIILVGECMDGWGAEGYVSKPALMHERPETILAELKKRFEARDCPWEMAPCSSRYLFAKAVAEHGCQLIAVTGINHELKQTFIETAPTVAKALTMAEKRLGTNANVTVIRDGRRLIPVS